MFLYFGKLENIGVSIFIEEKNKALRKRPLTQNMLSYHGPHLRNENLQQTRRIRVGIKLEQFIYSELDESKKCTNYPNGTYASYADCDEAYVRQMMREHFDNLMPFWAAQNLTDITSLRLNNLDRDYELDKFCILRSWNYDANVGGIMYELIDGSRGSNCLRPCLSTKVILDIDI